MRSNIVGFALGVCLLQLQPQLPPLAWAWLLLPGLALSWLLRAAVLVAPHHSGRSSSTPAFIAAVQPRWTLLPVGYRNRFGHPREEVLERYRATGAQLLRTDSAGAALVRIDSDGISVQGYRGLKRRYWYAE